MLSPRGAGRASGGAILCTQLLPGQVSSVGASGLLQLPFCILTVLGGWRGSRTLSQRSPLSQKKKKLERASNTSVSENTKTWIPEPLPTTFRGQVVRVPYHPTEHVPCAGTAKPM